MDSTVASLFRPALWKSRAVSIGRIALAISLILYGVLVARHMGAYAGGSDSSGYLNNARLVRDGHVQIERRAIPGLPPEKLPSYTYIPLGFIPVSVRDMVPTYPIGLSLLIVGISPFTGWDAAPHVTMWLHALFGVVLMFALAREAGLSRRLSWLGALVLAASPLYLFMSVQAMTDVPSLTWCAASVLFAWWSRRRDRWALAAGFSVAVAVLVRPSDLLVMIPVGICLGTAWRRWLWLALGGAPGAVFLALFNLALYGKALTSGYGDVGAIFSRAYAPLSLANYARWMPVVLTPGIILLLALPWLFRRESPRLMFVLLTWMAVFTGFYTFYYHTHESWWYLRFLLPAFPAAILAMLLGGRLLFSRLPRPASLVAGAVLTLAVLGWDIVWGKELTALDAGKGEHVYEQAADWARAHFPANAVIVTMQTSGALLYYTDFTLVRWDQFSGEEFTQVERACEAAHRPLYAVLFPFEIEQEHVFEKHLPGPWTKLGNVRHVTFWRRDDAAPARPAGGG
jgi:hypothetical protein